jgi:hypothetical protein
MTWVSLAIKYFEGENMGEHGKTWENNSKSNGKLQRLLDESSPETAILLGGSEIPG